VGFDFSRVRLKIKYSAAFLRSVVGYHHLLKKIPLNSSKAIVVEKQTIMPGVWLDGEEIKACGRTIQSREKEHSHWEDDIKRFRVFKEIVPFETFAEGLPPYSLDN
jgi:hypothetical protein